MDPSNFDLKKIIEQNFTIPVSFTIPPINIVYISAGVLIAVAGGIYIGNKMVKNL